MGIQKHSYGNEIENYPLTGLDNGANQEWPYISVSPHYHDINFDVNILFREINILTLQWHNKPATFGNWSSKCRDYMKNNPQKKQCLSKQTRLHIFDQNRTI